MAVTGRPRTKFGSLISQPKVKREGACVATPAVFHRSRRAAIRHRKTSSSLSVVIRFRSNIAKIINEIITFTNQALRSACLAEKRPNLDTER